MKKHRKTNMNELSLKNLLDEVFIDNQLKHQFSGTMVRFCALDEGAIKSILNSGVFTLQESRLMTVLFSSTNTRMLNESTVNKLDFIVETIYHNKDWSMLTEGPFDKIKAGIKAVGGKISAGIQAAISAGWDKVKAVWAQFKDLVTQVADAVKEGLTKLVNAAKTSAASSGTKLVAKIIDTYAGDLASGDQTLEQAIKIGAKIDSPDKAKGFATEVKNLRVSEKHIRTVVKTKWVDSPFWKEKMIAGDAQPDPAPVKESTNEDYTTIKNLIEERNTLLSDNGLISELLWLSENRKINEAFDLIDKALKNEKLQKVISWCTKILDYIFKPLEKVSGWLAGMLADKGLENFSKLVAALGGPGTFVFAMLGILMGAILKEILTPILTELIPNPTEAVAAFIPGVGQLLLMAKPFLSGIKVITAGIGFATVISTFLNDMEKGLKGGGASPEGGEEAGAENAGYTPKGTFNLSEGRLVFKR